MASSYSQYCGLALTLDRIGGRWTLLIIRELLTGPKRFTDLKKGLPGIATNLLSGRLSDLEFDGIVEKQTLPPPASTQVYVLTDLGQELRPAVHSLVRWGGHFMRQRHASQSFRPHWMVLALQALAEDSRLDDAVTVVVELPDGEARIVLDSEGISNADHNADADVVLASSPQLLLGLAAGEIEWTDAVEAGLHVEGKTDATRLVREFFSMNSEA